jgi:PIN domain nuclease of toxin-antitoxin system
VDLDVEVRGPDVLVQTPSVILLDTNALIWLHRGDARAMALGRRAARLYVSPATTLELQFLAEAGRIRFRGGATLHQIVHDDRWVLDDPPSSAWFDRAADIAFTRDPFDRLILAHARLRRWRQVIARCSMRWLQANVSSCSSEIRYPGGRAPDCRRPRETGELQADSAAVNGATDGERSSAATSLIIDSVFAAGHLANSAFVLNLSATSS